MRIGVTGGLGLLGQSILRESRHTDSAADEIVLIDRCPGPDVVQADITNLDDLVNAFVGLDAVIHTASLIDLHLGEPPELHAVNVVGAQNIIEACRRAGVSRLVHMSSAEVITGNEPLHGVSESDSAYPAEQLTYYGTTKQAGEETVLAAADASLGTCAMRTYGLFGPGDHTVVPMFLDTLPGKRQVFIGNLEARTDVVFAPNLAHAMLLAAHQLEPGVTWSGGVFHITDAEPVNIQRFLAEVVEPLGYKTLEQPRLPQPVARAVASVSELAYRVTGAERLARPRLTHHRLALATGNYWLDSTKAKQVLGYKPRYDRQTAIAETQAWLTGEVDVRRETDAIDLVADPAATVSHLD